MRKYRLLAGSHIQWNPEFASITDAEVRRRVTEQVKAELGTDTGPAFAAEMDKLRSRGEMLVRLGAEQTYSPGQVVESAEDLEARYGREKFRRVGDDEVPAELAELRQEVARLKGKLADKAEHEMDELDALTVAELRRYAEDNELEVGNARTKPELLAALRGAGKATAAV